jgi:hypothetical protein
MVHFLREAARNFLLYQRESRRIRRELRRDGIVVYMQRHHGLAIEPEQASSKHG